MADFVLPDGREITFDLDALTLEEYRFLLSPKQKREDEDAIMARVCGITPEDYRKIPFRTWRRLCRAFLEHAQEPLAEKNSQSESTST
jgi:serine/threonine protein kinase HipA of HipAB toxin-antitoxin module